jgi:isoquinoline 1-oxidoreductase beta subunit
MPAAAAGANFAPNLFLSIDAEGLVTIVAHRSEMGTGIRTALPLVVADELDADLARVRVEQAIGDRRLGDQNTDGSRSMRDFYQPMRERGAAARAMLEAAAAALWGVPASECRAEKHAIRHAASGRQAGFGELVAAAAELPVPAVAELGSSRRSAGATSASGRRASTHATSRPGRRGSGSTSRRRERCSR